MWRITGTRINGTESVSIRWADTKLFQIACFESLVSMFNYCLNLDRTSTNAKPSMLCPRHCDGSLACSFVNGGEKSWRWAVEKCGALEWRIGC
jgi:hypothetical protein